jgi:hypothetical protein
MAEPTLKDEFTFVTNNRVDIFSSSPKWSFTPAQSFCPECDAGLTAGSVQGGFHCFGGKPNSNWKEAFAQKRQPTLALCLTALNRREPLIYFIDRKCVRIKLADPFQHLLMFFVVWIANCFQ